MHTHSVRSPRPVIGEGYDLGPAKWPEPWMGEAIEKFQIRALTTCGKDGCGGEVWLFGEPRVGVCSKCSATYVEDVDIKLIVVEDAHAPARA